VENVSNDISPTRRASVHAQSTFQLALCTSSLLDSLEYGVLLPSLCFSLSVCIFLTCNLHSVCCVQEKTLCRQQDFDPVTFKDQFHNLSPCGFYWNVCFISGMCVYFQNKKGEDQGKEGVTLKTMGVPDPIVSS
jgi:hypothetical protein